MLSGKDNCLHHQTMHWNQVYKNHFNHVIPNNHARAEKYQINVFIPIEVYDAYIEKIETLLQCAIDDEIILMYKKIGGTKTFDTNTMQESIARSYARFDSETIIQKKLIDYNNPVIIYPSAILAEELAKLCLRIDEALKEIQEDNKFLSVADLYLTNHLSFRRINLYQQCVDVFKLSDQQLRLLKKLASKSYLFNQLEEYIYSDRQIQKYVNQLRNAAYSFNEQDKQNLKQLKTKLDYIENDSMNLTNEDIKNLNSGEMKNLLKDLKTIVMEQTMVTTYEHMREEHFLGLSDAADNLEEIINSSQKMGLPGKYGETCRVPHDPRIQYMPVICRRYTSNGKVFFNLRASQNENFMTESMRLIVNQITDKSDFDKQFSLNKDSDEYVVACFEYYFSDSQSSSNFNLNWLKMYSFHEEDTLSPQSQKDKFRMQIILSDLIAQSILSPQKAGILLNTKTILENKKIYPFTYAYQQLKIKLSRIKTKRSQLSHLMQVIGEYNKILDEHDKFELLKAEISQTRIEVKNAALEDARFFKCIAQSNLVDALKKFENEIITEVCTLLKRREVETKFAFEKI